MNKNYFIKNSLAPRQSLAFKVHRQPVRSRSAEGPTVSFDYDHESPSYPEDHLKNNTQQIYIEPVEGAESYTLHCSGTVDDQATISISGGGSYSSDSGAGVPIDGDITVSAPGYHQITANHTNISYPPNANVSFIHCTVGPAEAVVIEPEENDPPEECTCECGTCVCENPATPPGGPPPTPNSSPTGRRTTAPARFSSNLSSSSGGSSVTRTATAASMSWSCAFGAFRGLAGIPTGRLEILAYAWNTTLAEPAGLALRHPFATSLLVPEGGVQINELVRLCDGMSSTNYLLNGLGNAFFPVGASQSSRTRLHPVNALSLAETAICPLAAATHIRASYEGGYAVFYTPATGECMAYISALGQIITAEEAEQYLAIVRESENGTLRQIWNLWDGLADIVPNAAGGYTISLYLPSQVTPPVEEGDLFTTAGAPFKTFAITGDAETQSLTISETDRTLPASMPEFVSTWSYAGQAWSLTTGTGNQAVSETRTRTEQPEGGYQVETVLKKGELITSRSLEVYSSAVEGELLLSRTDAYGTDIAQTTAYAYDTSGRLVSITRPDGGVESISYDAQGRETMRTTPWSASGDERIVETTYRTDADGYSNEPARIVTQLATGAAVNTLRTDEYTYATANGIKRVERRSTAAGSTLTRLTVAETYTSDAENPHARGRLRMTQAENGVQTWHDYAATSLHGALYTETIETRVNGETVPGQSTRTVHFITAEGNTVRTEHYALLADDTWVPTEGITNTFDIQNRLVGTTRDNGRTTSRALICTGDLLWSIDEDGVRTDYAYDTARQLIETTRSEVGDGDTVVTPETITTYTRDAVGRVLALTTDTGPLRTTETATYDLLGRLTRQTDILGRTTTTSYSEDGLTVTQTLPSGATLVTTSYTDGASAHASGTGQRELRHIYDFAGGGLRHTTRLADNATILAQEIQNGFGDIITLTAPTTLENTYVYTRSVYNALGQLTRRTTGDQAPTLFEYDAMGATTEQTLLLDAAHPSDVTKNRIVTQTRAFAELDDGVYEITTTTRTNAAGDPLTSLRKRLVSRLSSSIESKTIAIDERGHASTTWTEYTGPAKRTHKSAIPTSDTTAVEQLIDGFITSQSDHAGVTTTFTRAWTSTGITYTQTDGRGNTTTTLADPAGRTVSETDAAGNVTTIAYATAFDLPVLITDAQGKTACYQYDLRGRKTAEYGTGIQPALFAYDDADRLTTLTTFRADEGDITADPSERTDGDITTWQYHDATGLQTAKLYADHTRTLSTYDAENRPATHTNARSIVVTYTHDPQTGRLTGVTFSDDTTPQTFAYNHLGQITQITDAAGTRTFTYNEYAEPLQDHIAVNATAFPVVEHYDHLGRSSGYTLKRGTGDAQIVTYGYDPQGRLNKAGFVHGGQNKQFTFARLANTNLLQSIACPNNIKKTYAYEEHRELVTSIDDTRATTDVVLRGYAYDQLGRPVTRTYARHGTTRQDTFTHNNRSELTAATLGTDAYGYAYDNIGNRKTAEELARETTYDANNLNQYASIAENEEEPFVPTYDGDGNQTLVKTLTGIWTIAYNALNRPVRFTRTAEDGTVTTITADYDFMGRRVFKKVETTSADPEKGEPVTTVASHQRYLYRGYLQIAALDLTRSTLNALWYILWDPTEPVATRPLAIQTEGSWYTYGLDLTKNVTELYNSNGAIANAYAYEPFGGVTQTGTITNPLQWSSEVYDAELGMVSYNFRFYNPRDGRWISRDPMEEEGDINLYGYADNNGVSEFDILGMAPSRREIERLTRQVKALLRKVEECIRRRSAACCSELYGQYLNQLAELTQKAAEFYADQYWITERDEKAMWDVYGLPTIVGGARPNGEQLEKQKEAAEKAWEKINENIFIKYGEAINNGVNFGSGLSDGVTFGLGKELGKFVNGENSRWGDTESGLYLIGDLTGMAVSGKALWGGIKTVRAGRELSGKNWRIAPFGNKTNHPLGKYPHYHRRGINPKTGQTKDGQGIKRHRPLEKKSSDTSFWDRF